MLRSNSLRTRLNLEQLDDRFCLSINPTLTLELPAIRLDHGVTVLAWARVDGVSPLQSSSTPATSGHFFDGKLLTAKDLQGEQQSTAPIRHTSQDDVVVDGRIITGENYDSADIAMTGYIRIKKLNSGG